MSGGPTWKIQSAAPSADHHTGIGSDETRMINNMANHEPASKAIRLSNGRIAVERPLASKTAEVVMVDGKDMTTAEWEEYCRFVVDSKQKRPFPR